LIIEAQIQPIFSQKTRQKAQKQGGSANLPNSPPRLLLPSLTRL
jgi:hypothetical protein